VGTLEAAGTGGAHLLVCRALEELAGPVQLQDFFARRVGGVWVEELDLAGVVNFDDRAFADVGVIDDFDLAGDADEFVAEMLAASGILSSLSFLGPRERCG